MPIEQYREVSLLLLVSIAAVNDLMTRRIPNRLLLAGIAGVLVLCLLSGTPGASLLSAAGTMLLGLALFLPFYLLRGMAAGDVKLMAVVGAYTDPGDAFQIALLTWGIGGVMVLLLALWNGRLRLVLGNVGRMVQGVMTPGIGMRAQAPQASAGAIPYGVAIALGTIVVLVRHYG